MKIFSTSTKWTDNHISLVSAIVLNDEKTIDSYVGYYQNLECTDKYFSFLEEFANFFSKYSNKGLDAIIVDNIQAKTIFAELNRNNIYYQYTNMKDFTPIDPIFVEFSSTINALLESKFNPLEECKTRAFAYEYVKFKKSLR